MKTFVDCLGHCVKFCIDELHDECIRQPTIFVRVTGHQKVKWNAHPRVFRKICS